MPADTGSGRQLRQLVAQLAVGVVVLDHNGSTLFLNPVAERLLGEIGDLPLVPAGGRVELQSRSSDGTEHVAELEMAEIEWDGAPAYVATLRDVTERKRLEERYRRTSQTLEAIVEASPLAVVSLGVDFSVNFWNRAADELFVEPDQLSRGLPLPIARDPANQELFRVPERLGRGETGVRLEAVYNRPEGDPLQLAVFVSPLRDAERAVTGMVAILEETTERKRVELEAREDPLTGVANRRVLMQELEAAIHRAQAGWPGAVLLVDIDGFKEVNDVLGHSAGDKVLAEIANRLQAALRPGDVLARYGGDELVVIPARATIAEAEWIGERLRASIEEMTVDGAPGGVSLSVGIVPIDGDLDPERALDAADRALYEAKRQGRNRVVLRRAGES